MSKKVLVSVFDTNNCEEYKRSLELVGLTPTLEHCPKCDLSYDGLVLGGGTDINPKIYGQENIACKEIDFERDECDLKLLEAYAKMGKPILGVCRGIQLINAFFGGTLHQHIKNAPLHRSTTSHEMCHAIRNVKGTFLYDEYGEDMTVNSIHHQGIDKLSPDFIPIQYAFDGLIEGIMHKTLPIFAVQWHPERISYDSEVFRDAQTHSVKSALPLFKYYASLFDKKR